MSTINSTSSSSSTTASAATLASAIPNANGLANENTFLQLLVAQLKNQDPLQPQDGTQFVSQLAQFSDLEQNLAMRTDIDAIKTKYVGSDAATTTTSSKV